MPPITSRLPPLAPRLPGNLPPAVERPSVKEHTEQEWLEQKALIEKLYINDNRKLSEIMAVLESKYGFAATEQMYKKRFKKWNIRKRAYRKSPTESAASTPVTTLDVALESAGIETGTVEMVPRKLPPVTASLSLLPNPPSKAYAGLEIVLESAFSWSQGKLDSFSVVSDPMSRYLANPNQPPIQDSRTMYRTFELVFDLWSLGKGDLAGMAARKGFYALEFVLTEDHPDLLWHILDTIFDMIDRGHLQLLGMFLQHTKMLARNHFPSNHPIVRILEQLMECDFRTDEGRKYICYLLRQAWLRNVDILSERIGSTAPQHLWLYEQIIWDARTRLRRDSGLAKRGEFMYKALDNLVHHEDSPVPEGHVDSLRIDALMLEFTQMDLGDKKEAEKLALKLLDRTESAPEARSSARFHAYARKMLARLWESKHEWDKVEENLKYAITKREAAHGTTANLRVIRDMWVLVAYYQKIGRHESAMQVIQDALMRAQQYLNDIPG